jgi:hypothetical protein
MLLSLGLSYCLCWTCNVVLVGELFVFWTTVVLDSNAYVMFKYFMRVATIISHVIYCCCFLLIIFG